MQPPRAAIRLAWARFVLLGATAGCAGAPASTKSPSALRPIAETTQIAGHPPVAVIARDGDPSAAVAVAVLTDGIEPARGAEVPVALAAVMEARLAAAGVESANVTPAAEGFRVRVLSPGGARARDVVSALRAALLTPVTATGPEMTAVARKLAALAQRPIADPALRVAARCTGEAFASADAAPPLPASTVEAWRAASAGLGRVVFGAVGPREEVIALAAAVGQGPLWPHASPLIALGASHAASDAIQVYDATPDLPPGAARVTFAIHTANAERAAAAGESLGDAKGALVARLGALEPAARVRDVTATAHVGGGCLVVTVDLPAPDATADPPVALAAVANVVREQMLIDVADARISRASARDLANRAADPREAAERAAFWTLLLAAGPPAPATEPSDPVAVVAGLAMGSASGGDDALAVRSKAIRTEIDRATAAQGEPVAEMRARLERGQPELWVLVASPCGTEAETDADAGAGAIAAMAAAEWVHGETSGSDASAEGWAAPDGVGVVAHAAGATGETSEALARRVAGLAARSFGAAALDAKDLARARGRLLASSASGEDAHGFGVLADALAPGRPSWMVPWGTMQSLERSSDATVRARLDALRSGPLRVAVLANQDASQVDVALQTVDQWIARRPGGSRACPPRANVPPPRPGTYGLERPGASSADAWLAFALPPFDPAARAAASVVAATLDGAGGLLEKALGAGLARGWQAHVSGPARAPALVVRVSSAQGTLDAAVAEVRALFDRLRLGALTDADRARALAHLAEERLAASLDPKARLVALWRGEAPETPSPSLDAVRAFAALLLKDDALILVATRPPRVAPAKIP
jgi:hypothetical protein